MKAILAIILITFSFSLDAQVLKDIDVNLNPGGVIHDVVYDSYYDAYIVVGNFTSINGLPRNNLAFIDATTFTVTSDAPITSIDGEIRTVSLYKTLPLDNELPIGLPDGEQHLMHIGGNFTSINGVSRVYAARLTASHSFSSPPIDGTADYNVNILWDMGNLNVAAGQEYGVNDLLQKGDTLVVAGEFIVQKPYFLIFTSGIEKYNLIGYNVQSTNFDGWIDDFFPSQTSDDHNTYAVYDIFEFNDHYYIVCNNQLQRYDLDGLVESTPNYDYNLVGGTGNVYDASFNISEFGDTVLYTAYNSHASYSSIEMDYSYPNTTPDQFIEYWPSFDQVSYFDKVYSARRENGSGNGEILTYKRNGYFTTALDQTILLNSNWAPLNFGSLLGDNSYEQLFLENDYLFLSSTNLTTVDGQPKTGLAIFCLEPEKPRLFSTSEDQLCEGDVQVYTVPQAQYAEGYQWSYSGSGALYRLAGTTDPFLPLNSELLVGTTANSIEVSFPAGTSNGTISVEAFGTCNTTTDYLFSEARTLDVTIVPIPNISMANAVALTCAEDTVHIIVESTTALDSFTINYNGAFIYNDSLTISILDIPLDTGYVVGTVTEPINGCFNMDSTLFELDTIALPILQSDIDINPNPLSCTNSTGTLTGNVPDASMYWTPTSDTSIYLSNPHNISLSDPTFNYTLFATYISNGCTARQDVIVGTEETEEIGAIVGYTFGASILDTIDCTTTSLSLEVTTQSGAGSAQWIIGGSSIGNTLIVDQLAADSAAASNTLIYSFETIHPISGCADTNDVVIFFDLDPPTLLPLTTVPSINCSTDSALLVHPQVGGAHIEGWLDVLGAQTFSDSLFALTAGTYYYQVSSMLNGCTINDTVEVIQTTELLLDLASDTVICPGEIVTLSVNPINNPETPSYTWSTGVSTPTTTAIGGSDTSISVIVETPSGCIGYDTISLIITPPIVTDFLITSGCSDGNIQVINTSGGAGNYTYSIDSVIWETNPAFDNLSPGDYALYIQDDLGCIYTFNETVTTESAPLDVAFLVSTYNGEGDTIVAVNVSDFTGFDSLVWSAPSGSIIHSESDSMLIFSVSGTGWFDVSLTGYQDTCAYTSSDIIYFGEATPVYEEDHFNQGIDTVTIYPNPTQAGQPFTVYVEFGTPQNYVILITNPSGQALAGTSLSGSGQIIEEQLNIPISSAPGIYYVHVIADYDAVQLPLLITN